MKKGTKTKKISVNVKVELLDKVDKARVDYKDDTTLTRTQYMHMALSEKLKNDKKK